VLTLLLESGIAPSTALEAWRGPLDGIQDFAFGAGAIEVKATAAPVGVVAAIGLLEQLDDFLIKPIFVAAVSLSFHAPGETLPQRIARLREVFLADASDTLTFGNLLLHAGFSDPMAPQYTRRFSQASLRILRVSQQFPRITRGSVPIEIRTARYEVDLD